MARLRPAVKAALSTLVVVGVFAFFSHAVRSNWAAIAEQRLQPRAPLLLCALLLVISACLLNTCAWLTGVNALSTTRRLSFKEGVATVNTTSLTKYLPGKLWSFALQMYWLTGDGFSKSLVLYANVVNLLISLAAQLALALLGLLWFGERVPLAVTLLALLGLITADVLVLKFHAAAFKRLTGLLTRRLRRDVADFDLAPAVMLKMHTLHAAGGLVTGLSTCVLGYGIGYDVAPRDALLLSSATLLADLSGFVAFMVPAGLGVRESLMYVVLGSERGSLALVLPVASRLLYLASDLLLGLVAVKLLHGLARRRASTTPPASTRSRSG